jgi:alpha-glucosidase
MPWSKDFKNGQAYLLNQTMARMKAEHKALSHGGMKFLYAKGNVVALARFYEDEVFVAVISTGDQDAQICLPLGAVGASCPKGDRDVFGRALEYETLDGNSIAFTVKAHQAYFMECQLR